TSDALTAEVGFVGDFLRQIDVRQHVGNLDRRRQHLKSLRWRWCDQRLRRRRFLLRWRRLVLLHLHELDLLGLRLLECFLRLKRSVHRCADQYHVHADTDGELLRRLRLLGLSLDEILEHSAPLPRVSAWRTWPTG